MVTIRVLDGCDRVNSVLVMLPNSGLYPVFRLLVRGQSRCAWGAGHASNVFGFQELGMWLGGWGRALQRTKNLPSQRSPKNSYQLTQVTLEGDSSIGMSGLSLVQPGAQRAKQGCLLLKKYKCQTHRHVETSSSIVPLMKNLTGPKNVQTTSSDSFLGQPLCETRIESV